MTTRTLTSKSKTVSLASKRRKASEAAAASKIRPSAKSASSGERSGVRGARGRKLVSCLDCALCCSYVAIETDPPSTVKRATQLLWYLYHERVSLYCADDDWMVQFETRCKQLLPDRRCGVYETRPHICREYSETDCEVNSEDEGQVFYTPDELIAYLKFRYPRVYRQVMKGFAPPAAAPGRKHKLPVFEERFRELRMLGVS